MRRSRRRPLPTRYEYRNVCSSVVAHSACLSWLILRCAILNCYLSNSRFSDWQRAPALLATVSETHRSEFFSSYGIDADTVSLDEFTQPAHGRKRSTAVSVARATGVQNQVTSRRRGDTRLHDQTL